MEKKFDVLIVGGSYAGLSAAMALGRSLRNVLVVDGGKPCNAQTPHSHNFLTQDGKRPADIAALARQQLEAYATVKFKQGLVSSVAKTSDGFRSTLASGEEVIARKLIFATGIKDHLPDVPGVAACWGISVIHCPYCHGYEYHGMKTAIYANGEAAWHYAVLVSNLTKDLAIITNGKPEFSEEQWSKLKYHGIAVFESGLARVEHRDGYLTHAILADGQPLDLNALYFRPPFVQHCAIPESLGAELNEQGHLKVDALQKTTVDGVFACGDNCSMMRSVANAVSSGNIAGAAVNRELATEQF